MKSHRNSSAELGTEPIRRLLFRYALPAIIAMTAASLYNIVDSIFIGHGCGALALGGLTVAKPFMDICAAFGSFVGVGASTLVAIFLGERNYASASRVLGNVIVLNVILGALIMVVGLIWLDPILYTFGASVETIAYARDYMQVILYGNILTHIYFGLNNVLRSMGHPKFSMVGTIVAVSVNVILDPLFIFYFDMGVRGAAWATIISQAIAVVWQMTIFFNPNELLHFRKGIWRLDRQITLRSFAIGASPFLMNLAHCLVVVIINNQLTRFGGDLALATYGIINRFTFVFAMIVMGLNQGMQPIAGYNFGAQIYSRVKKVLKMTIIAATCVTSFAFIVSETIPYFVARLFTTDEELIAIAIKGLRICSAAFPIVGFQMVTSNFFQSIGKASKAVILSSTRQLLLLVPLLLILPNHFKTVESVFVCMPLSDALSTILAFILLKLEMRKFNKLKDKPLIEQ